DRPLDRGAAGRPHPHRRQRRRGDVARRRRRRWLPRPGGAAVVPAPRVLVVDGGVPCHGTVRTPGEKSISHRSVLLGALAEGTSVIRGLSDGADGAASLAAVGA